MEELFNKLARSEFRRRFRLGEKDAAYLSSKGLAAVREHARDLLTKRLAPAHPVNDGSQTPMRGHPVFVAQHATGTCCRSCLQKWHGFERGRALTESEVSHLVSVIAEWLRRQNVPENIQASKPDEDRNPNPNSKPKSDRDPRPNRDPKPGSDSDSDSGKQLTFFD